MLGVFAHSQEAWRVKMGIFVLIELRRGRALFRNAQCLYACC